MKPLPHPDELYRALVDRDEQYEGLFYACVRTTGIFCRPTCRARKPKRTNVDFVRTAADALHAGYRPCKVCTPLSADPSTPEWAARLVSDVEAAPHERIREADLRERGLDPSVVRRHFQREFGVTFHAFQRAWRLGGAMRALNAGEAISNVAFDSGYESESGFRDAFARLFGRAPGRGRQGVLLTATWIPTPLGRMIAIASAKGLVLCEFADRRALEREIGDIRAHFRAAVVPGTTSVLADTRDQLEAYFAGRRTAFDIPLDTPGSSFQRDVWAAIGHIPFGGTVSYQDIAHTVKRPSAVRAVGRATGDNRVAILIPCHRVVRADGSISGYGGGRWRKEHLLALERDATPAGDTPQRMRSSGSPMTMERQLT